MIRWSVQVGGEGGNGGGVLDWGVRWGKANRGPRVGGKGAAPGHFQLGLLREVSFSPTSSQLFQSLPPKQDSQ